ncbi:MAG TPA: RhuM family protein [Chloroflexota bacterium]|nr:RhuM family protein [Chloroflexota bacterium]HUM67352.1 RhuM family protein [Chloroflexota bacterium]
MGKTVLPQGFRYLCRQYDTKTAQAQKFFATVQNKFHYATHGRTAA